MPKPDSNREFTNVTDKEQLIYLVDHYLVGRNIYVKGLSKEFLADLKTLFPEPSIRLFFFKGLPSDYSVIDKITIYAVVKRYIELTVKKIYFEKNKGDFELISAKIAHNNRLDQRIPVSGEEFYAENFRLSQYSLNPNTMDIPISVKVAFDKIKPSLLKDIPECESHIFGEEKEEKLIEATKKTQKVVYIENVYDKNSFLLEEEGFLNCKKHFGDTLDKEISDLIANNINSLLIYPVIFVNIKGEGVPVGYFKITSSEPNVNRSIISRLYLSAIDIVNYIRDANVTIIKEKQEVMNVSRKGVQLLIKDLNTLDIFIANREDIVFDIRPKPTFRLTLFGKMVNVIKTPNNNHLIGLKIIGGEKRHGMGAWESFLSRFLASI